MELRPEEISNIIRSQIKHYETRINQSETGTVILIGDGIARAAGLEGCMVNAEFHSEHCKNIFDICTRFNMGMMSKTEAKDALKSCDLSNKANFKSYVQRDLEVIFAEEPKKKIKKAEPMTIEPESHVVVEKENE